MWQVRSCASSYSDLPSPFNLPFEAFVLKPVVLSLTLPHCQGATVSICKTHTYCKQSNLEESPDGWNLSGQVAEVSFCLQWCTSLIPRPRPAFHCLQYRKAVCAWGEPGNEASDVPVPGIWWTFEGMVNSQIVHHEAQLDTSFKARLTWL